MGSVKPWQVLLFILAVIVLGAGVFISTRGRGVDMADRVMLVDLVTGDRFIASTRGKNVVLVPEENPETKAYTLVTAFERDGKWFVFERHRGSIETIIEDEDLAPDDLIVDLDTYELDVSEAAPRRLR